jgi:WD40 repeat protein
MIISNYTLTNAVFSLCFSKDGNNIINGNSDGTINIWDINTGYKLKTIPGHNDKVLSLCYSNFSNKIISSSSDGSIKIWDAINGNNIKSLLGHTSYVHCVC